MSRIAHNLLFHYIGQGDYALSVDALVEVVEEQLRQGLRPARVSDYLGQVLGPDAFTISFDDAHRSVLQAAPALRELGITPALFVPTASPGQVEWCLDWHELRELAASGWEIHSHAHRHRRMSWREYGESVEERNNRLRGELTASRRQLRERVGVDCRILAYPYGEAAAPAAVRGAGFGAALTVALDRTWSGDLLQIPRLDAVPVAWTGQDPMGISVIVPACDRLPLLTEVVRRVCAQSYPPDRFELVVVDDGSSVDLAQALAPVLTPAARVVRLPGSSGTFRAGQARQLGADLARFEVLAFLDADVAVDRDFLWSLDWAHRRDPRTVLLGALSGYNLHDLGQVHTVEQVRKSERLTGEHLPVIPDRSRGPALASCLDNPGWLERPWELCYTGNLSLRAGLLQEVGGFSRAFSGWGFEDVDLGLRLHRAGVSWAHGLWALGYHMEAPTSGRPSNPFRRIRPQLSDFQGVLDNLDTLQALHDGDPEVRSFCEGVRADVSETCSRPHTVGVECGAPLSAPWPFERQVHQAWPGGRDLWSIRDRLAYAAKVGATELYLLGGDVLLRPDLPELLAWARQAVPGRLTAETTGSTLHTADLAGLDGVVVELWVGQGHPRDLLEAAQGVARARSLGLVVSAKLVVGEVEPLGEVLAWLRLQELDVWDAVVIHPDHLQQVREAVPEGCSVRI